MEKKFIFAYDAEIRIEADSHAEAMDIMAKLSNRDNLISDYSLSTVYSVAKEKEYRVYEQGYDGVDRFIGEENS